MVPSPHSLTPKINNCHLFLLRLQMAIRNLLLLLMFSFHCFSCFSNSEDPFANFFAEPPSSMVAGEEGDAPSSSERSSMERFDPLGGRISSRRVVNVDNYGAKGDGTDDKEAFEKAWKEACACHSSVVFLVPEHKRYLLKPIIFSGPCKSDVTVMIKGTLEASPNPSDWDDRDRRHWIVFSGIRNLVVGGGGILDGKGKNWWRNSCKINTSRPCISAPTALTFNSCKDLRVEDLKIKDSQQIHVLFEYCTDVLVSRLTITAPSWSPNTDGIHVTSTKNILITHSVIGTGDDCISIVDGSKRLKATDIVCGPGHGISIGSLGAGNSEAHVSNVLVDKVTLKNTTNGVRIKTWQGGHGYAKNIIFQNIEMHNVHYPIVIDQNYCDSKIPCHEQKTAVAVSHVLYKNIKGTSASEVAINFNCSRSTWCHKIVLQDITLKENDGVPTKSSCNHVEWVEIGKIFPSCAQKN
ncbi:polygalacturonase-like [Elaeis guineensis]|uniref:endo-polygalacturonase n=1 Tax=Elaeis guineensis var. tenera TaxID=51953 RepID=A0A6I9QBU8_ELAGV|nr:polygalacturonase-like [Elaeis guineensis]